MHNFVKATFFICILCYSSFIKAQVCTGTFGEPLINQTFGRGDNINNWYGPLSLYAPGASTFTTFQEPPGPARGIVSNQSGLVKTPAVPGNPSFYWQPHADHTGDENGLMLLIDGIGTPTIFFEQRMDNLCPNTTLRLSIWVLNANTPTANAQNPNMILRIVDANNNRIGETQTGNVPPDRMWHQYFLDFTNNNSSTIILQLINNTPTNSGNDFALDDITVQACGPTISPIFSGNTSSPNMCEGNTYNFNLDANLSLDYNDPVYQWQEYIGNTWIDMAGKTAKRVTVDFLNRAVGEYQYRLVSASNGNINNRFCRAVSNPLTVTVHPPPIVQAKNNGPACIGNSIQLNASGGTIYRWIGPNGYTSNIQNPIINNVNLSMNGAYVVTVDNGYGCLASSSTVVEILPPLAVDATSLSSLICAGESTQIFATGGLSYIWFPANGLSNANIANPIASPAVTTTYTANVSNGYCTNQVSLTIEVKKSAKANAGEDKKLIAGSSITLNGKVSGDNATYYWFPADYLDDPTKLNPIATPTRDITYKLIAQTDCNTSEDEVKVKVFQKVVIPNTFSPNGDGINDTWNIPIMEVFPLAKLQVFNRSGQLVYQGNYNSQSWDGKTKGKDLPGASYYYKLFLSTDQKVYTGWVLLIR